MEGNREDAKDGKVLLLKRNGKILTLLYNNNRLFWADADVPGSNILNNIYIGKVKNIVQNIGAAFVEFAPGRLCFLSISDCQTPIVTNRAYDGRLVEGDEIVLQICAEGQKAKEARASASLSLPGKYLVLSFGEKRVGYSSRLDEKQRERLQTWSAADAAFKETILEYGIVFRTNIRELEELSPLTEELLTLKKEADTLRGIAYHRTCYSLLKKSPAMYLKNLQDLDSTQYAEIITDDSYVFREAKAYLAQYQPSDIDKLRFYDDPMLTLSKLYSVEARLSEALDRKVWLKSGGYLIIDRTEALTCIDVNSGKYIGKKKQEDTYFHINLEAAQEIARQLQLRNISGMIIIDFINMENKEQKHQLLSSLREYVKNDPVRTMVVDMTPLGLVEVTRKKKKKPLWEQLRS